MILYLCWHSKFVMNISRYSLIKLFEHVPYIILYMLITRYICCACERSLNYIEYGLWVWVTGLSYKVLVHNLFSSKLWDSLQLVMELGIPFAKDYYTSNLNDLSWSSEAGSFRLIYRCYTLNGPMSCPHKRHCQYGKTITLKILLMILILNPERIVYSYVK
jgi:hypothetical protein